MDSRPSQRAIRPFGALVGLVALAAIPAGCDGPRSILLVVDGDLRGGVHATEVEVAVSAGGVELSRARYPFEASARLPQSLRLVLGEETGNEVDVEVTALQDGSPFVGATRRLVAARGEGSEQRICLWLRCVGSNEADCLEGSCAPVAADGDGDVDGDGDADQDVDADGETDADPDGPDCLADEVSCFGDALRRCTAGEWATIADCELGCVEAEDRCALLAPSNVAPDVFDLAAVDVVVEADLWLDTDLCDASVFGTPPPYDVVVPVDGGPDLCVVAMASLTVETETDIRTVGDNAVVLLVAGDVVVRGSIQADAGGHERTGPAGRSGGDAGSPGSFSTCGGGLGSAVDDAVLTQSGGGGGGHGGVGGQGADSSAGAPGGLGGLPRGSPELVPLHGGCGGAGAVIEGTCTGAGHGGAGGGALQISAGGEIVIEAGGFVDAGGGGAQGGCPYSGGAGGGAGGSILLEAGAVVIDGAVAANGGGGSSGAEGSVVGNDGGDGTVDASRAAGGASPSPGTYSGRGGSGGSGTNADGEEPPAATDAGGGGGAAGRIRINTRSGSASILGVVSPTDADAFSEGIAATR